MTETINKHQNQNSNGNVNEDKKIGLWKIRELMWIASKWNSKRFKSKQAGPPRWNAICGVVCKFVHVVVLQSPQTEWVNVRKHSSIKKIKVAIICADIIIMHVNTVYTTILIHYYNWSLSTALDQIYVNISWQNVNYHSSAVWQYQCWVELTRK